MLKRVFLYLAIAIFLIIDYMSMNSGTTILDSLRQAVNLNMVFPLIFVLVIIATVFAVGVRISGMNFFKFLVIISIFLASAFYFSSLSQDTMKIHFLQYELITLIFFKALEVDLKGRIIYFITTAAVVVLGTAEEVTQAVFPDRSFDLMDLKIDIFATLFMIATIYLFREFGKKRLI
jgi:hypothetical protein